MLDRYAWDAEAVRDALRQYVIRASTRRGGRQSCDTLGKIANCQVGVFPGSASPRGPLALDRELFLPQAWCADRERCHKARVPEGRPVPSRRWP
jgi:hypothetical protein